MRILSSPIVAGVFEFKLTVRHLEYNCLEEIVIPLVVHEPIKPVIQVLGESSFCLDSPSSLSIINANQFSEISWYLGNELITTGESAITPLRTGKYSVTATSPPGCAERSDAVEVTVVDARDVLLINTTDNTIEFGDANYNSQICRTFTIQNTDSEPFTIQYINLAYKHHFTTPMSQFPLTIAPNEIKEVMVCFVPAQLDELIDSLFIVDYCSTHDILLKGTGTPNTYYTSSICDIRLVVTTRSSINTFITLNNPKPNPTSNNIAFNSIGFSIESDGIDNTLPTVTLYNELSIPIDINWSIENIALTTADNTNIIEGEIRYSTTNLPNGVYFVRVNYYDANKIFTIIIAD